MRRTTSLGSFRTRTMSADSIATSVPAPIAIPTSAWTSAGASLTPSPTIATRCPFFCNRSTVAALSPKDLREERVEAELASDVGGRGAVVARQYGNPDSHRLEIGDGLPRFVADHVGEGDNASQAVVDDRVDGRLALSR